MKLGKHDFAKLIAYIQKIMVTKDNLSSYEIEDIDDMIDFNVPQPDPVIIRPSNDDVDKLLMLMQEGTRKIEAIKMHRTITGYGLKESKDAVEKYWVSKGHYDPTSPVASQPATLGDILHSAGRTNAGL